jgi:hypothetical protein
MAKHMDLVAYIEDVLLRKTKYTAIRKTIKNPSKIIPFLMASDWETMS